MNCDETYKQIRRDIKQGATRYRADSFAQELRQRVAQFRDNCDNERSTYLEIVIDHAFNYSSIPNTVQQLKDLLSNCSRDDVRVASLILLARLTLESLDFNENCKYRKEGLEIARRNAFLLDELVILDNWLFAAISVNDLKEGENRSSDLEEALKNVPSVLRDTPEFQEILGRAYTHQAKLLLLKARTNKKSNVDQFIEEANELYGKAIDLDKEVDHRRVNYSIEWVDNLVEIYDKLNKPNLDYIENILEKASYGLDTHPCDLCRGYFHGVKAKYFLVKGNTELLIDPSSAIDSWSTAVENGRDGSGYFEKLSHPYLNSINATIKKARSKIEMTKKPKKIFLSHSGTDKELVREFKKILELLKFEPWLDEDAMSAGIKLERGLLQGFKDSCAAVFFVTPNFKDTGYLATEVDYAIAQKRQKGDNFAIITLVLPDDQGKAGTVPDLLKPFVWKTPKNGMLEALRELLRALPLQISYPVWKT